MENLTARVWVAVVAIVAIVICLTPNVVHTDKMWWPTQRKLNYGLDIQGGLHLVMGVDVAGVVKESTNRLVLSLKAEFQRDAVPSNDVITPHLEDGEVEILASNDQKAKIKEHLQSRYATVLQLLDEKPDKLVYRYYESYLQDFKSKVIAQAIETIRNRIDEFGVSEPSISQQGSDRVLIQLPGMADAERAKALINTAAKLDFMMVAENPGLDLMALITAAETAGGYTMKSLKYSQYLDQLNKDLAEKLPPKTMILFEKANNAENMDVGRIPFLLKTDTNLGGDALTDAFVSFDQYGAPEVAIRFNAAGTNAFRDLTANNIGKQMAIVLDRVVKTAPNIQTAIGNGEARVTLGGGRDRDQSMNEAKMIATSLRAGALPAALEQLEERRVGPSLGADSVKKAQLGSLIGAFLIFAFVIIRYKSIGVISDLALVLNILMMLAMLSALGATLTLPGIAGIALTVGFAVDANVLINERMREELRKGHSMLVAIREGYGRALSAILDANITTGATALVLLYFGTGPVRGFAVTLLLGIVSTMFANVFLSRVMVDFVVHKLGFKKLSV